MAALQRTSANQVRACEFGKTRQQRWRRRGNALRCPLEARLRRWEKPMVSFFVGATEEAACCGWRTKALLTRAKLRS